MIKVFTDGGARGNPGPAAIGVYVVDENNKKICGFGKKIGIATNNVAEYEAVIAALSFFSEHREIVKDKKISFFLDSKLVCSQITGLFKVKDSNLRALLFLVREKEGELGTSISYSYIPREENTKADQLMNMALDNKI